MRVPKVGCIHEDVAAEDFEQRSMSQIHLMKFCGTEQPFRDRYKILRSIGKGGYGATFLARDLSLPKPLPCVIKEFSAEEDTQQTQQYIRKLFRREVTVLQQFDCHPQIPPLFNFFELEDHYFLVQGCALGYTLAELVNCNGCYSEEAVCQFLHDFLPLLQDVHTHQVIHRDIKPENIMRCSDGRLVLIDFGLAVLNPIPLVIQSTSKNQSSCSHIPYGGTEGFAPPEQIQGYPVYASDLYALGVTCLCLLSAQPIKTFERDPETSIILWNKKINVSHWFGDLLNRMLQPEISDRFQSANHVLQAMNGSAIKA